MPTINYSPIFTYIGLNKMARAITTQELITLSKIHIGDASTDLNYIPSPDDIDIKHKILEIDTVTVNYTDLKESHNAVMRISGTLLPQDSVDFIAREYGVYDSAGDLILIGRIKDSQMLLPAESSTGLTFTINMSLSDTQRAFVVNNVPNTGYVSTEDLGAHISAINPHNVTKEDLILGNVNNTSDKDKPINPELLKIFSDTKFAIGFTNRLNTVSITHNNSIITVTATVPVKVYKRGIKYSLYGILTFDASNYTGDYYIGYNPILNELYLIDGTPDFYNDILVTWFYRNSTDGIIWLNDERHGVSRNIDDARLHHLETGAVWISGGALTYVLNDATRNDISISTPIMIADEDLNFTIVDKTNPTLPYEQKLLAPELPVLYIGSDMRYHVANNHNTNLNWLYNDFRAVFNNTTLGTLETVPNNRWICYWVIWTTDQFAPVKLILGRDAHDTADGAINEVLTASGLPMPEVIVAYKIVLNINDSNNNLAKSKITNVFELANNTRKNSIMSNSHELLTDRNISGQHNVKSIRGLEEALANAGTIKKIQLTGTFKADATETDSGGKITLKAYQADSRNMVNIDNPVFTDIFGANLGVTSAKYTGIALALNGKLYCAPWNATQVLEIDPIAKTTTLIGTSYSGIQKWHGIALAPNGKLYCSPFDAAQVLEIDPVAKTTTLIGTSYPTTNKWGDIVLGANGKLYCASDTHNYILEINPTTKTTALVGPQFSVASKCYGIALAPNSKLYCAPYDINQVLELDTVSKTTKLIGSIYTGENKWTSVAMAPNGKLYAAPDNAAQVLEIDPVANISALIGNVYNGDLKWVGITLAPNGRLYCAPHNHNSILEINPIARTTRLIEIPYVATEKWHSVALASNGKLYASPYNATQPLEIDTFPKTTDFGKFLKIPSVITGQPVITEPTETFAFAMDPATMMRLEKINPLSLDEISFNLDGTITYSSVTVQAVMVNGVTNYKKVDISDAFLTTPTTKPTRWLAENNNGDVSSLKMKISSASNIANGPDADTVGYANYSINGINLVVNSSDYKTYNFPIKIKALRKKPFMNSSDQTLEPEFWIGQAIRYTIFSDANPDMYSSKLSISGFRDSPLQLSIETIISLLDNTSITFTKNGNITHDGTKHYSNMVTYWERNTDWILDALYPLYIRVRKNGQAISIKINNSSTALSVETSGNYSLANDFKLDFTGSVAGTYDFFIDILNDTDEVMKTFNVKTLVPVTYVFPDESRIVNVTQSYGARQNGRLTLHDGSSIIRSGGRGTYLPSLSAWISSATITGLYFRLRTKNLVVNGVTWEIRAIQMEINPMSENSTTPIYPITNQNAQVRFKPLTDNIFSGEITVYMDITDSTGNVLKTYLLTQVFLSGTE